MAVKRRAINPNPSTGSGRPALARYALDTPWRSRCAWSTLGVFMKPTGNANQININAVNAMKRKTAPCAPNSSPARNENKVRRSAKSRKAWMR